MKRLFCLLLSTLLLCALTACAQSSAHEDSLPQAPQSLAEASQPISDSALQPEAPSEEEIETSDAPAENSGETGDANPEVPESGLIQVTEPMQPVTITDPETGERFSGDTLLLTLAQAYEDAELDAILQDHDLSLVYRYSSMPDLVAVRLSEPVDESGMKRVIETLEQDARILHAERDQEIQLTDPVTVDK